MQNKVLDEVLNIKYTSVFFSVRKAYILMVYGSIRLFLYFG